MLPIKKILCPTDFSEPSYMALKAADELAVHFEARLIIVHVVAPIPVVPSYPAPPAFNIPSYQQELEASAVKSLDELVEEKVSDGTETGVVVVHGDPASKIVEMAGEENVDLIVIATHGLTGLKRFMFGSVAEKVVRMASCPVLTIQVPSEKT